MDELIYNTWEEWGMYYLYKLSRMLFKLTNWVVILINGILR